MGDIPLQQEAIPEDPERAFAWVFVGLPTANKTAPLMVGPDVMRQWSKRLWDAGFRHHPEHQTVKYFPPPASHNWIMGSAGHWDDISVPMPPEVTAPDLSHLSAQEKQIILERLQEEFAQDTPDSNFAGVIE